MFPGASKVGSISSMKICVYSRPHTGTMMWNPAST